MLHSEKLTLFIFLLRKENFELPPPPKYIAFSGQGVSLSGGSPGFTQAVAGKVNMDASPPKVLT